MKSILLLAANPKGTKSLRLQEEEREIKEQLRIAGYDKIPINSSGATRPRDIHQAMLDWKPQVVHFSGHGAGKEGLVFEDETGQEKLVGSEALANFFRLFTSRYPIECVVLNACYSEFQAQAIARHVDYVIGMSQAIRDRAAIEFSVGFYKALGAGESFEFAYELGCNAIELEGIPEYLTPIIWAKGQLIDTRQNNLPPKTQVPNPRGKDVAPIQEQITTDKEAEYQQQQEAQRRQQEQAKAEYQKQQQEVERQRQRQQSTPTTPSKPPTETDDLSSDKGVDYTRLRNLLAQGKWQEADEETLLVMLKVAGREQEGWLRVEDIEKFPCTDLRTIDTLWVKYSNGRFGFSVQKRIWESVGGTPNADYETYCRYGNRIKWRVNNDWLDYDDITFSAKAPEGHLPVLHGRVVEGMRIIRFREVVRRIDGDNVVEKGEISSLASRLVNCSI